MVIRPWGMAIWDAFKDDMDKVRHDVLHGATALDAFVQNTISTRWNICGHFASWRDLLVECSQMRNKTRRVK